MQLKILLQPPGLEASRFMDIACLHNQNKSGFFGVPAFIQPIRAII